MGKARQDRGLWMFVGRCLVPRVQWVPLGRSRRCQVGQSGGVDREGWAWASVPGLRAHAMCLLRLWCVVGRFSECACAVSLRDSLVCLEDVHELLHQQRSQSAKRVICWGEGEAEK